MKSIMPLKISEVLFWVGSLLTIIIFSYLTLANNHCSKSLSIAEAFVYDAYEKNGEVPSLIEIRRRIDDNSVVVKYNYKTNDLTILCYSVRNRFISLVSKVKRDEKHVAYLDLRD
jgi:hypothetical protein